MKKRILHTIVLVVSCGVLVSSCDKYLDMGPVENLSVEEAFRETTYARNWLYNLYSGLENGFDWHEGASNANYFVGGCDEMEITADYSRNQIFNEGSVNPGTGFGYWAKAARYSRKEYLFLENIGSTPLEDSEREEWIGEAKFLRALYNFWALRIHGPIPVYDHLFSPSQDFDEVERNTFEECVEFIVKDCDDAAASLPATRIDSYLGRATSVAALALKSRVLLYAASPLYNGNPDYATMRNRAGEPLIPTTKSQEKWQRAADAAKACITACGSDYTLHYSADRDPYTSYREVFTKNWNEEVLFAINAGSQRLFERSSDPIGVGGYSLYSPTQQMVDAYRMSNGADPFQTDENGEVTYSNTGSPMVNATSGYSESGFAATEGAYWPAGVSNMYVNREPRFYASVNFPGQTWKNRILQLWASGVDGYGHEGYFSRTGYLQKKWADENVSPQGWTNEVLTLRSWIYFRLAEVYLNYAEALNEAKNTVDPEVLTYLNRVRERGGLPALTGSYSQAEMRKLIHQERRVELAFEAHRFFDTRRWKTAAATQNVPCYSLSIRAGSSLSDPSFYQRTTWEDRLFIAPAHYLLPIPQSEIDKCKSLVQNIGY